MTAGTTREALLTISDLTAAYGQAEVLFGVSLNLQRGEAVALIGRNGAGKTSTLKRIMGLMPARGGSIGFDGHDITRLAPFRIARLGLGYVPEERRIFTDLTVYENLEVGRRAAGSGRAAWTPERLFALFPNLAEMRGRRASAMSGGEQQMLSIARTLMGNPQAILLDEPSEGLAPVIVEQMAKAVLDMKRNGVAVLLCEQNLQFATAICDRAYVIERGEIRYHGTTAELAADSSVREQYLTV
jgi:branched-chain amino acid transport system ATP-binding protein